MSLSSELISQFAKITKDKEEVKKETTVYGTIVNYNGSTYVKLDGSDLLTPISTTTETQSGERVTVMIKNHTATVTGNISSPAARTDDVKEIGNKISEFEIVIADKVSAEQLEVTVGRIKTLESDNVTIKEKLTANEAVINNLDAKYAEIDELYATKAEVDNLKTTKLDASVADIKYATIENLEATKAEVDNLDATYATIESLEATKADIDNLDSKYATIQNLNTSNARIADLEATSLTADSAVIENLKADVADIDTLIFGSASGDVIQTSFANAVIAQLGNAQIKSAMIDTISANQIQSGSIVTNNVTVTSEDGKLLISDETIQIKDANRVRVQIGKDSAGDYSINIWDTDGNLMFSEGGLTESAIKESIIRDDMVSDIANISASKLNISSLFKVINEDGSNTLNSSKIAMDGEGQTLDVAFNSMTTNVSSLQNTVTSQNTTISAMQGEISSKVSQQKLNEVTDDLGGKIETLNTGYSNLTQTVDGINATVASHTTQIQNKADASQVTEVNNKVTELETSLEGFQSTVSETYATKTELNDVDDKIGAIDERLVSAQTQITQNTEKIELAAVKTEVDKQLEEGYYTKSEIDSAIDVKADEITLSVSETYATKTELNDVDDSISTTADEIHQTIVEQNTSITTTCEGMLLQALESYTQTGDFEDYKTTVASQLELLTNQMNLQFSETLSQINLVDSDLQDKFNTITKYFTFNINGLTIGQTDNPYKVIIDNDRYSMTVNDVEVLWFDGNGEGHIPELTVTKRLNLFGLMIDQDEDSDLINCEYIGGV